MPEQPDVVDPNSFSPKETDWIRHGTPETGFNCFAWYKQTGNFKMQPFNSILACWKETSEQETVAH